MKYYLVTVLDGTKLYLRRYRITGEGVYQPTMLTPNKYKAMSFSKEKAETFITRMSVAYSIEPEHAETTLKEMVLRLQSSIIAADPNVVHDPPSSDLVIRDLYRQVNLIIEKLE